MKRDCFMRMDSLDGPPTCKLQIFMIIIGSSLMRRMNKGGCQLSGRMTTLATMSSSLFFACMAFGSMAERQHQQQASLAISRLHIAKRTDQNPETMELSKPPTDGPVENLAE